MVIGDIWDDNPYATGFPMSPEFVIIMAIIAIVSLLALYYLTPYMESVQ